MTLGEDVTAAVSLTSREAAGCQLPGAEIFSRSVSCRFMPKEPWKAGIVMRTQLLGN